MKLLLIFYYSEMYKFFCLLFKVPEYCLNSFLSFCIKKRMKKVGRNVIIHPLNSVYFGVENLSIGNNVIIPRYSHIFCIEAPLKIGNNVLFGPSPTIVTGNHRIDVVGTSIYHSHIKAPGNDEEVIIKDDICIGANVTIFKGIRIGRASVVAGGSVVNKSFPEYSIIGGIPAKLLKFRFSIDDVLQHEMNLYSDQERLKSEYLINTREIYK